MSFFREEDQPLQQKMEQHMADDLRFLGYNAISSITEFGPKAFTSLNREQALEKLRNSGTDAVITILLRNIAKETRHYPGHPQYGPSDYPYHQGFSGYYSWRQEQMLDKGYYVTNTKYNWESNFYELEKESLVYSVQTESFDPVSAESIAHEYGKMIVRRMVKSKMLEEQKMKKGF